MSIDPPLMMILTGSGLAITGLALNNSNLITAGHVWLVGSIVVSSLTKICT